MVVVIKFGYMQWQIVIRFQFLVKNLYVIWVVYWFNVVFMVFRRCGEYCIFVVVLVIGFFLQDMVYYEWIFNFLILVFFQFRMNKYFQFMEDGLVVVVLEYYIWCFFLYMVQVELFIDFMVVVFCGFFQVLQVSVKCFFVCLCCIVNML